MLKCKKGFTLVELLAIIVILAVIAVITVPIVLGIIDNAKVGAARVSAYGYKDSINKFYVTSLSTDEDFSMDDGIYTADEIKSLGISVSGDEPDSNSWVVVSNNEVSSGCFQFGEYKVEMLNGDVSNTEVGSCGEYPIPSCPKCVFINGMKSYYFKGTPGKTSVDFTVTGYKYDFKELSEIDSRSMTTQVFLGFMLDENDQIERAFVCSFKNDIPFCIEGTEDGSKNTSNGNLLNSASLWNNTCTADGNGNYVCDGVMSSSDGKVSIGVDNRVGQSNEFDIWSCTTRDAVAGGIECELQKVR